MHVIATLLHIPPKLLQYYDRLSFDTKSQLCFIQCM